MLKAWISYENKAIGFQSNCGKIADLANAKDNDERAEYCGMLRPIVDTFGPEAEIVWQIRRGRLFPEVLCKIDILRQGFSAADANLLRDISVKACEKCK